MLETTHTQNLKILENIYDCFSTPPSKDRGIIILTKKLFAFHIVDVLEDRGIAIKSRVINKFTLIGSYCPYLNMKSTTIDFVSKWAKDFWLLGADWESYGSQIVNQIPRDIGRI